MKRSTFALVACALALAVNPVKAVKPLDAAQLQHYCVAAEGTEAQLCVAYINGFLDGAVATDARVAENVVSEIERDETFTERAIRTRILHRLGMTGPTGYAEFCVGDPVPILEVVAHVVDELAREQELGGQAARDIVYAALRRHYPCAADDLGTTPQAGAPD